MVQVLERLSDSTRGVQFGLPTQVTATIGYNQGKTRLNVSIRGPVYDRASSAPDAAAVIVHITRASGVTSAGSSQRVGTQIKRREQKYSDADLAAKVREAIRPLLLQGPYLRHTLTVSVHVVNEDGSLLSAMVNGTMAALLGGGVQCTCTAASSTIAVDAATGELVYGPTKADEDKASAVATFVHARKDTLLLSDFDGNGADSDDGIKTFSVMEALAAQRSQAVVSFLRQQFSQHVAPACTVEMSF
eukprot:PhM_4_TR6113/c0_g1_i1/m.59338/K12590/RRP46, EXOSC5; exosome complex component RRP46